MRLHPPSHALAAVALLAATGCNSSPGTLGIPPPGAMSESATLRAPRTPVFPTQYSFTKYPIPTSNSQPNRIVVGPDKALWFTEEASAASKIGRVTTQGAFTEFQLTAGAEPSHVASALGDVWFSEKGGNDVGFVTPGGQITYYGTPAQSTSRGLTQGISKTRVWFTEFDANKVAFFDAPTATITEYQIPTPSAEPYDIVKGPDGAFWFTEYKASKIARVTDQGAFTEYPTPSAPQGLVVGPDGALWFTETQASKIGRITTAGTISEYPTPTANSGPNVITKGPDGALWFTEFSKSRIGRIAVDGTITEIKTPDRRAFPLGITTGPDKNIWFVESRTNAIVKLTL
jgi:virginiamycin B lyase